MKMLFLSLADDLAHFLGVGRKIRSQLYWLNQLGVETQGYMYYLTSPELEEAVRGESPYLQTIQVKWPSRMPLLYQLKKRSLYFQKVRQLLSEQSFDLIYFRYPLSDWQLLKLVKQYPGKIVFEHQGMELEEIQSRGGGFLRTSLERWMAPYVFKYTGGSVAVTREVAHFEKHRSRFRDLPTATISNGFDVALVPQRKAPAFDGKNLNLLLVANVHLWHGLDRLVQGLAEYSGPLTIQIFVVGMGEHLDEQVAWAKGRGIADRIVLCGKCYGADLDAYFNRCHLGVGSLGLHRIRMNDTSTLKIREYMARGIPFIYSGIDRDLQRTKEIDPFGLAFEAQDKPIDMSRVVDFTTQVYSLPDHPDRMRQIALQSIDMKIKMAELKEFLESRLASL